MSGQYLTAVLELRPSRRKAASMERVRAAAEAVFWSEMALAKSRADEIAGIQSPKDRRDSWRLASASITKKVRTAAAINAGLSWSVAEGLARDVTMAVSSYVESRAKGHVAEWPVPGTPADSDYSAALDLFTTSTTKDREDEARNALSRLAKLPGPRPMVMARGSDGTLLRETPSSPIVLALNILRASDKRSKAVGIKTGIDAATGEVTKAAKSQTRLLIPVSCSKWHEQKFLSGRSVLKSSIIVRRGERWFMCAQFEMREAKTPTLTGARLGVDRGIINPIALAVVRQDGSLISMSEPLGSEIGKTIRQAEDRKRSEQKRRGVASRRHVRSVDNALHQLANRIVADAKSYGAQVVFEKLDGLKQTIVTKRAKGARKGGWRKALKVAQLGKLERIVAYKLKLAGLPAIRDVFAGGTSITCPACSHRDPKNRVTQAVFACVACGLTGPADPIAGINVARRDIAMKGIKGGKLAPVEQDMVARLRLRGDGGLGPLAGDYAAATELVAVHASAASDYDPILPGLTFAAGQKPSHADQNPSDRVLAERVGAILHHRKQRKVVAKQSVVQERLL